MPTEGTAVIERLRSELGSAGAEVQRCRAASAGLDGQTKELFDRRGRALLELARRFLPEISRPAIEATFDGIRSDLLAILGRKEAEQGRLRDGIAEAEGSAHRLESELGEVTGRLNAKVAERERLEAQVAEVLKGNPEFKERSDLALKAEEQLHRNEQRVAEMQKEAAEKLPSFERSRLFRYLYDRKHGTDDDPARGIIRSIDDWLARLIHYAEARDGYEFLLKAPGLVAEEVDRRKARFAELMGQVESIQKAEADGAGLTTVLREGEELGARRDALTKNLEALRQGLQRDRKDLTELDRAQNAFYAEAINRFQSFLGQTKLALLEQHARRTPEPEDDALVKEIAGVDSQIGDLKGQLTEADARRHAADRIREGLDLVVSRYRQSNFDSERSYFDGLDLGPALARFEDGSLDADGLWSALKAAQRFRPHWVESTAGAGARVIASPTGRVLMGAVIDAVDAAMRQSAYRGIQRRGGFSFPDPPARPTSPPPPHRAPDPPRSKGGFTSGEGF